MYVMVCSVKMSALVLISTVTCSVGLMHTLCTLFGIFLHSMLSNLALKSVSIFLFTIFGVNMIYEGLTDPDKNETSIDQKLDEVEIEMGTAMGQHSTSSQKSTWSKLKSRMFSNQTMVVFFMTMSSEMGDMSQFTGILLSATFDAFDVIVGGILGFCLSFTIAVFFGKMIMKMVNERTMNVA